LKTLIAALALVLTACGGTHDAHVSGLQGLSSDGLLQNVVVTPTNGGINPDAFALNIKGDVLLGSNSCQAAGFTAKLVQSAALNGVVTVRAVVDGNLTQRACPRNFNPVFKTVSLTVFANHTAVRQILIKNVNAFGTLVNADDLIPAANAVVVGNVSAEPTNGGINPDVSAVRVKATFTASNACMASAQPVELIQKKIGPVVYVTAVRKPQVVRIFCTAEFKPVIKEISTIVMSDSSDPVGQIIVRNVGSIGHDQKVDAL
jgi:hypothetical protein